MNKYFGKWDNLFSFCNSRDTWFLFLIGFKPCNPFSHFESILCVYMNWKVGKYLLHNLQNLGMSECFCKVKYTILMVAIPSGITFASLLIFCHMPWLLNVSVQWRICNLNDDPVICLLWRYGLIACSISREERWIHTSLGLGMGWVWGVLPKWHGPWCW